MTRNQFVLKTDQKINKTICKYEIPSWLGVGVSLIDLASLGCFLLPLSSVFLILPSLLCSAEFLAVSLS